MQKDVITLNIAILPDEKTKNSVIKMSKLLSSKISTHFVLGENRLPHITIYQAAFPTKNIEKLKSVVSNIASQVKNFQVGMDEISISHETFLFWNCIKSNDLINLHNFVVEKCNPLREGNIIEGLPIQSAEDKYDVENYGSLLIGPRFSPHITIARIKNELDQDSAIKTASQLSKDGFNVSNIIVGELAEHGTVTKIISTFPLLP